ncbi:ribonuclease T2 family protein [Atopomonas hussainii]|uniref:ribonuclease T2 family protein n=1 Tax=Atopomonas hussainii TaxID=1429083 RepID=UPI0009004D16|nr:hypothetical protein [Atopomonas hussainii]
MKICWAVPLLLLLLGCDSREQAAGPGSSAADFDYYLLALSWSPDYCAANAQRDAQQCGRPYGFVLHGLWPQHERGWPSNCKGAWMDKALMRQYAGLYPNDRLFVHEWRKHGTCSGLSPEGYLSLSQQLKQRVQIPPAFQQPQQAQRLTAAELTAAFTQSNPDMPSEAVASFCSGGGRFLKELRVCFDRSANDYRACSAEVQRAARKSCGQGSFVLRPVR